MATEIVVQFDGFDRLEKRMQAVGPGLFESVRAAFRAAALMIQSQAKREVPVDTGNLRRMIVSIEQRQGNETIWRIGTNVFYGIYVEKGTRPHFPPPRALAVWAARHGMKGAEFAIAKKIAQRGTQPRPFLGPAAAVVKTRLTAKIEQLMRGAVR